MIKETGLGPEASRLKEITGYSDNTAARLMQSILEAPDTSVSDELSDIPFEYYNSLISRIAKHPKARELSEYWGPSKHDFDDAGIDPAGRKSIKDEIAASMMMQHERSLGFNKDLNKKSKMKFYGYDTPQMPDDEAFNELSDFIQRLRARYYGN